MGKNILLLHDEDQNLSDTIVLEKYFDFVVVCLPGGFVSLNEYD